MNTKIKRGQILKELRLAKGLKQADLADLLKITQQAYQRYEYGTSEPNADGFSILADFYGVTTDYLLGREPEVPEYLTESEKELEEQLMEKYRKLPEQFRKKFLQGVMEAAALQKQKEQKIEIQQNAGTVSSSMEYVGTIGEELERREQEARAEAEAIRKDTA